MYIFILYFYCIAVNLSFCGAFSVNLIFVYFNAFYVPYFMPFGVISDDDDNGLKNLQASLSTSRAVLARSPRRSRSRSALINMQDHPGRSVSVCQAVIGTDAV